LLALKDGIYWGLGHSSTIFLVGLLTIAGRLLVPEALFAYLEAGVGLMLVALGAVRMRQVYAGLRPNGNLAVSNAPVHGVAYGIGMLHGLAGSGAMVLLVTTQTKDPVAGLVYLLVFGLGSVAGMLVASGIFSLPFSKFFSANRPVHLGLTGLSSALCLLLGFQIMYHNLRHLI